MASLKLKEKTPSFLSGISHFFLNEVNQINSLFLSKPFSIGDFHCLYFHRILFLHRCSNKFFENWFFFSMYIFVVSLLLDPSTVYILTETCPVPAMIMFIVFSHVSSVSLFIFSSKINSNMSTFFITQRLNYSF